MNEYFGFAIFFIIFIAVYGLLNYFVLSHIFKLFNIEKNYWFYIIFVILTLSYLIAAGLEALKDIGIFRAIYIFASVWMGVLFLTFCTLLIYLIIDRFVPITTWITGITIIAVVILVTIYSVLNAYTFKVNEFNINSNKDVNLKVVQVSDIHLGVINSEAYLKNVVNKINELHPDVVLITGDLLDGKYNYSSNALVSLNSIDAPIYFASGNHDEYANLSTLDALFKKTKVKWLRNEVAEYDGIYIVGLDDTRSSANVGIRLNSLNKTYNLTNKYTILLNHRPIGWKDASRYVNLMLSGHTHAGQIWPFTYLVFLEGNVLQGKHTISGNKHFMLYVNSGTGTWGPPMRIGSHTELTAFNINGKKN